MPDALLGLDIGTTSTKAVLFDLDGSELVTAQQSYPLLTPQPGWAEQDSETLWQAVVSVLRRVVAQAGERRILALAAAAQSGSLVLTGAGSRPIYQMITWLDQRTKPLVQAWKSEGKEPSIRQLSGWHLNPGLPLPMIAWLRVFEPEIFGRTERFLGVLDFINCRLTGNFVTDLSAGTAMQLIDISTGRWSPQLCSLAGLSPGRLSQLAPAGTVIGEITSGVSQATGLAAGTPVVNGGHDQCCTALALGLNSPGEIMLSCGTAWVITGIVEAPEVDNIPTRMDLNFHVVPDRWTISQFLGGFGATFDWWLKQCWQAPAPQTEQNRVELVSLFNNTVGDSEPGSNGLLFLPLGGGAQLSAANPLGGFVGLRLDHTRADMGRALLEGVAFELRWALESLRQTNLPVEQLWLVGGATRSPVWPQILADVSGARVSLSHYTDWPALGATILAGVGSGLFASIDDGIARFKKSTFDILPNRDQTEIYDQSFKRYKEISQQLARL